MPVITVNNHNLHCTDDPSLTPPKATIVFIHGLGSTQSYFTPIIPHLSAYRCITFDTYGARRSDLASTPGPHSIATISTDVLSLLDLLSLATVWAAGYLLTSQTQPQSECKQ